MRINSKALKQTPRHETPFRTLRYSVGNRAISSLIASSIKVWAMINQEKTKIPSALKFRRIKIGMSKTKCLPVAAVS